MDKYNVVDNWISSVQYAHSKSQSTAKIYRRQLKAFSDFIDRSPQQILDDYDNMTDREFRRKYAQYLRALISCMNRQGYTSGSIGSCVGAIRSFFKYNDLPLGYVPVPRGRRVVYHNRDVTKEEVAQIIAHAKVRDKAYFCMMAQSGLRPCTISSLRYEHIQKEFEDGTVPLKIDVPAEIAKGQYRSYFTFVGPETVKSLKLYLRTRPHIKPDDYLFIIRKNGKPVSPKNISKIFHTLLQKLEKREVIKIKKRTLRKPAEVRLYNLRKFFRKYATPAGFEYVQFWMGHVVREGADEHYRPKDPEFHRKLYVEKAMPYLRIETATPNETEQTIKHLEQTMEELRQENLELKRRLNGHMLSSDQVQELLRRIEKLEQAQK